MTIISLNTCLACEARPTGYPFQRKTCRFTMRGLLLAVFVSAVTADVVRLHLDELRAEQLAIVSVEAAGGRVSYETDGKLPGAADRLRARWIERLPACRRRRVVSVDLCGVEVTPQLLQELSRFPELCELYLVGESVTDERFT